MSEHETAYFSLDGDIYRGNNGARGPWSVDHCHAGPVTGALARELERAVDGSKQLVRLTVDLLRPVPLAGFRIKTEVLRDGRRLATGAAELIALDGKVCASARSIHIAAADIGQVPSAPFETLDRAAATPGLFPITKPLHGKPGFARSVEIAYPPGETPAPGPTTLWMKSLPLLDGETPSPFQRLCPLADCPNGISRNAEPEEINFVNPDLTIAVHRLPETEWLAGAFRSDWNSTGIGVAGGVIYDEQGPCASVLQTLVLTRNKE